MIDYLHAQMFQRATLILKITQNVEIIDRANNDLKLRIKEMLHIDNLKPTLNRQKHSHMLSLILGKKDN